MQINRKPTGRAKSIPAGLGFSAALALTLTILLSLVIAKLVENQKIAEENIGYAVMCLLTVVSFISAMTASGKIKHQRMLMCLLSGVLYWGILLSMTALFFGGQYEAVGETGFMIFLGSLGAGLLGLAGKRYPGKKPCLKT